MSKITGKAIIRVDGEELRTEDGATLNIGGQNRSSKMGGGKHHGYQEEDVPPSMECSIYHDKKLSLRWLSDITNATVMFETDTGSIYTLRDAFTTEPVSLNAKDGTVALKMEAPSVDES